MKILVVVTKTAEVEVDLDEARVALGKHDMALAELDEFSLAEVYVAMREGNGIDLTFDRTVTAVSILEEVAA